MNHAAKLSAKTARLALLACLACALLPLRTAQAEQVLQPGTTGGPFVVASAENQAVSSSLPGQSAEQDLPSLGDPTETLAKPLFDLPSLSDGAWRWIPQGMVPYVGPRTPDDQKDRGFGLPLEGRGWRNQPFSIGTFAGATDGGALVPGHVHQQPSFYGGINLGWDYDHYWGIEKRLGFGVLNLTNQNHDPIPDSGLSVTGEYRLMYYPLGDARWRPFLTAGVGWSDFYFHDDRGAKHLDTVGMIPFGVGLKYLCNERLAIRFDLIDEMTFGDGALSNFHYVALAAGLEFRYGRRLINMPWHRKSTLND
jgi:hypothetical protein